jgi:predicted RNA-binding protein YlqC (UPF0109 family)
MSFVIQGVYMKQNELRTKYQEEPLKLVSVRLSFWHIQTAKKAGKGNISRGIRTILESAKHQQGAI